MDVWPTTSELTMAAGFAKLALLASKIETQTNATDISGYRRDARLGYLMFVGLPFSANRRDQLGFGDHIPVAPFAGPTSERATIQPKRPHSGNRPPQELAESA